MQGFTPVDPTKGDFLVTPLTDAEARNDNLLLRLYVQNEIIASSKAALTAVYNREQVFINQIFTGATSQYKVTRLAESTARYNASLSSNDNVARVQFAALR